MGVRGFFDAMSIKEWNGTCVCKLHFNSTSLDNWRLIIIIVTVDNSYLLCGVSYNPRHLPVLPSLNSSSIRRADTIQLEAIKWLDCIFSGCPINVPYSL